MAGNSLNFPFLLVLNLPGFPDTGKVNTLLESIMSTQQLQYNIFFCYIYD